jgi:hypothetical protein
LTTGGNFHNYLGSNDENITHRQFEVILTNCPNRIMRFNLIPSVNYFMAVQVHALTTSSRGGREGSTSVMLGYYARIKVESEINYEISFAGH